MINKLYRFSIWILEYLVFSWNTVWAIMESLGGGAFLEEMHNWKKDWEFRVWPYLNSFCFMHMLEVAISQLPVLAVFCHASCHGQTIMNCPAGNMTKYTLFHWLLFIMFHLTNRKLILIGLIKTSDYQITYGIKLFEWFYLKLFNYWHEKE